MSENGHLLILQVAIEVYNQSKVKGATVHTGMLEMPRVDGIEVITTGKDVSWPQVCARCLTTSNLDFKEVRHWKQSTFEEKHYFFGHYPICNECRTMINKAAAADGKAESNKVLAILPILVVAGIWLVRVGGIPSPGTPIKIIISVVGIVLALIIFLRAKGAKPDKEGPDYIYHGIVVSFRVGHFDEKYNVFKFAYPEYAELFKQANKDRIVNKKIFC